MMFCKAFLTNIIYVTYDSRKFYIRILSMSLKPTFLACVWIRLNKVFQERYVQVSDISCKKAKLPFNSLPRIADVHILIFCNNSVNNKRLVKNNELSRRRVKFCFARLNDNEAVFIIFMSHLSSKAFYLPHIQSLFIS